MRAMAPRHLPVQLATYTGLILGILRGFDLVPTRLEALSPLPEILRYFEGFQIRNFEGSALRPLRFFFDAGHGS